MQQQHQSARRSGAGAYPDSSTDHEEYPSARREHAYQSDSNTGAAWHTSDQSQMQQQQRQNQPAGLPILTPASYQATMHQHQQQPYAYSSAAAVSSSSAASTPGTPATPSSSSSTGGSGTADILRARIRAAEENLRMMHANTPGALTPMRPIGGVAAVGGEQMTYPAYPAPSMTAAPAAASTPSQLSTQTPVSSASFQPASLSPRNTIAPANHTLSRASSLVMRTQRDAPEPPPKKGRERAHEERRQEAQPGGERHESLSSSPYASPGDAPYSTPFDDESDSSQVAEPLFAEDDSAIEQNALMAELSRAQQRREAAEAEVAAEEEAEYERERELQFRRERMQADAAMLAEIDAERAAEMATEGHQRKQQNEERELHEQQEYDNQQQQLQQQRYPPHAASSSASSPSDPPVHGDIALIMRVSMDHGQVDLVVPRGADSIELAIDFCAKEGLGEDKVESLALSIEQHLDMLAQQERQQAQEEAETAAALEAQRVTSEKARAHAHALQRQRAREQLEREEALRHVELEEQHRAAEEEAQRRREEDRQMEEVRKRIQRESEERLREMGVDEAEMPDDDEEEEEHETNGAHTHRQRHPDQQASTSPSGDDEHQGQEEEQEEEYEEQVVEVEVTDNDDDEEQQEQTEAEHGDAAANRDQGVDTDDARSVGRKSPVSPGHRAPTSHDSPHRAAERSASDSDSGSVPPTARMPARTMKKHPRRAEAAEESKEEEAAAIDETRHASEEAREFVPDTARRGGRGMGRHTREEESKESHTSSAASLASLTRSTKSSRSRSRGAAGDPSTPRGRMDPKWSHINRHSIDLLLRSARKREKSIERGVPLDGSSDFHPRSASKGRASSRTRSSSKTRSAAGPNDGSQSARSSASTQQHGPSGAPIVSTPAPYFGSYASIVSTVPFHERLHSEAVARKRHLEQLKEQQEEEILVLQETKKVLNKSRALAAVRVQDARPIGARLHEEGLALKEKREALALKASQEREASSNVLTEECTFHPEISEFARNIRRRGEHNFQRILDPHGQEHGERRARMVEQRERQLDAWVDTPGSFQPELNPLSQALAAERQRKEAQERVDRLRELMGGETPTEQEIQEGTMKAHERLHAESKAAAKKRQLLADAHLKQHPFKPTIGHTPTPIPQPFPPAGPFDTPQRVSAIYSEACARQAHATRHGGQLPWLKPAGAWAIDESGAAKWVPLPGAPESEVGLVERAVSLSARRFQRAKDIFSVLDEKRVGVLDAECMSRVASLHPADQAVIFGLLRRLGDAQLQDRARHRAEEMGIRFERALAQLQSAEQRASGSSGVASPPVFALLFSDFLHLFRFELALLMKADGGPQAPHQYDLLSVDFGDRAELLLQAERPIVGGLRTASRAQSRRNSWSAAAAAGAGTDASSYGVPSSASQMARQGRSRSRSNSRPPSRSTSRRASVDGGQQEQQRAARSQSQGRQTPSQQHMQHQSYHPLPMAPVSASSTPSSFPPLLRAVPPMSPLDPAEQQYLARYHAQQASVAHLPPSERADALRYAYEDQLAANEQRRHEEWLRHQQWLHAKETEYERQVREQHEASMALEAARTQRAQEEAARTPGTAARAPITLTTTILTAAQPMPPPPPAPVASPDLMALANMDLTSGSASTDEAEEPSPTHHQPQQQQTVDVALEQAVLEPTPRPSSLSGASSAAPSPRFHTSLSSTGVVSSSTSTLVPRTVPRRHYPSPSFHPEVSPRSTELAKAARKKVEGQAIHDKLHREAIERKHMHEYRLQTKAMGEAVRFEREFGHGPYKK